MGQKYMSGLYIIQLLKLIYKNAHRWAPNNAFKEELATITIIHR
jgi:hypothetical protein